MMPDNEMRRTILEMVFAAKEGHIPSSFSIIDILEVLYGEFLGTEAIKNGRVDRDIFILSKGHGAAALYAILYKHKILRRDDLDMYSRAGGILGGHPDVTQVPGVEASTGSLGHGLPIAVGTAMGSRIKGYSNRTVVLMGDGECQEGTTWEGAHVAVNQRLRNLVAIVDWNRSGAQLTPRDNLPAKWRAFGWNVTEVDGHNPSDVSKGLKEGVARSSSNGSPSVIIAHTIKGKGVQELEGHGVWHHRIPSKEEFERFRTELS